MGKNLEMVFCLLPTVKKIVQVTDKNLWNLRLKFKKFAKLLGFNDILFLN